MSFYSATAIQIRNSGFLIEGPTGSGKSDLALRCISRGGKLVGDDQVFLEAKDQTLLASPPKPLEGKLEVRGIGILDFPFSREVPIEFLIRLVQRKDVLRQGGEFFTALEGVNIRTFTLPGFDASTADKLFLLAKND